ncbi:DEKNAAC100967 [Brettanomyces naardenensis]|uniref:DEKNAAC100967 n=1 Tax=Brettanomyces naardenensis TaxID=13370 RepID=A0A448YGZ4_BRENA|nr:DEKNAAC100967 [Brettanomyces naardenensis]
MFNSDSMSLSGDRFDGSATGTGNLPGGGAVGAGGLGATAAPGGSDPSTQPINISFSRNSSIYQNPRVRRESIAHSQGMGGVSWGSVTIGSWLKDEVMLFAQQHGANAMNVNGTPNIANLANTNAANVNGQQQTQINPIQLSQIPGQSFLPLMDNPFPGRNDSIGMMASPNNSSYLADLEANYCKDYSCCGQLLPTLHDLLRHYEEMHIQQEPTVEAPRARPINGNGLDAVSTNEVFLKAEGSNSSNNQITQTVQNGSSPSQSQTTSTQKSVLPTQSFMDGSQMQIDEFSFDQPATGASGLDDQFQFQQGAASDLTGDLTGNTDLGNAASLFSAPFPSLVDDQNQQGQQNQQGGQQVQPNQFQGLGPRDESPFGTKSEANAFFQQNQQSLQPQPMQQQSSQIRSRHGKAIQRDLMNHQQQLQSQRRQQHVQHSHNAQHSQRQQQQQQQQLRQQQQQQQQQSQQQQQQQSQYSESSQDEEMEDDVCIDDPARRLYVSEQNEDRPFKCPVIGCDKNYKNQNGLKYHRLHGHQNQKLRANPDGSYSVIDPKSNAPYPEGAEFDKDKPYRCEVCGKRYKNLNGLKYHRGHSTH